MHVTKVCSAATARQAAPSQPSVASMNMGVKIKWQTLVMLRLRGKPHHRNHNVVENVTCHVWNPRCSVSECSVSVCRLCHWREAKKDRSCMGRLQAFGMFCRNTPWSQAPSNSKVPNFQTRKNAHYFSGEVVAEGLASTKSFQQEGCRDSEKGLMGARWITRDSEKGLD